MNFFFTYLKKYLNYNMIKKIEYSITKIKKKNT